MVEDAIINQEEVKGLCSACCPSGLAGLFNWFRVLWKLNDEKLVELNGVDYTLYLVFLRYAAVLCATFTAFNCVCMIPLYVTGDPEPHTSSNDWSTMNVLTLLNVTDEPNKMAFTFVLEMVPVAACAFVMLWKYLLNYSKWKVKRDPMKEFKDIDIAHFAVLVDNISRVHGVDQMQHEINSALSKVYPPDSTGKSAFVKVKVVGNYNKLYKKCV